ncbi:MAG: class I SAM-dependent methyltransferase [Candidatus Obscuribacterales bacterium]|nr:class I SAM-dependent methyltransferase [Candidatus Obscuribacterales bacterium]
MSNPDNTKSDSHMPDVEDGFVKTLNNTGYMTAGLDRFSQTFVDFAAHAPIRVMDVGAAYGVATLAALKCGATVLANDIDERHLNILYDRVPAAERSRLELLCGQFPNIEVKAESLAATLICRVMHFFDGAAIELSAKRVHEWTVSGGKVFVICETPFVGTLTAFADEYARRKDQGDPWPGLILDMHSYTPRASGLPKLGNWLDRDVLTRVFSEAGFAIDECEYFARPEFPDWLQLDGKESVGLIATKN